MTLKELKPIQALNKAFLKLKPNRTEIEGFKTHLITLLGRINDTESEEFHKNLVSDFLKDTYYKQNHFINTKGRNDLVIHNGPNANTSVGVIIEAKKTTNKAEMISANKLNAKALQELVLYYLRERIIHKNIEIKHLVATNINEWFIFDATLFDRLFAQNKNLVKQFTEFEAGRLADTKTDFFYQQIAEPFISNITTEIEFTYFNIQDFQESLRNADKADDNALIALFKLLSPEHLLKLPFANDSNSLDKRFYSELLHIIGLTETKESGKKLIERNKAAERHTGTILEDAIIQLDSLDKLSRLEKPSLYGNTKNEQLFSVALELSITWINRILFLKLLEGQLISYHKGDKSYLFLNSSCIKEYDDLNTLFFQVLAKRQSDRNEDVKTKFSKIPYLNSSLFEPTNLEHNTIFVSNLKDNKTIPIFGQTVLKDEQGKKLSGNLNALEYLFAFLNAYDFSSEGSAAIQEDNKTLINASVLGLIFEKINGYKDGSFFTPGFITMYMCRETIRKAVIQKFSHHFPDLTISDTKDIYNLIPHKISRKEANEIVNSLKICDPAVGSGHFLVSALNEIIALKNDLKILQDQDGKSLHRYEIEVVNDELIVTDENGELFEYHPSSTGSTVHRETQRIQETLFHEKQTIIENCLFGVDINPNSVKICRLRLWIELLKNAYYKNTTELETLPNIDINIKCGNSLVSRFALDADLSQALKKNNMNWSIDMYRIAVDTYRNAQNKEQKREMERLIDHIKADFRSEISKRDPKFLRKIKLEGELFNMTQQGQLFEMSEKEKDRWSKRVEQLNTEIEKITTEIETIKANKIYENALEWRFEFPEVLNDDGDFVGFDCVIGNPPYIQLQAMKEFSAQLQSFGYQTYEKTGDIYSLFYEKGIALLKQNGLLGFITSNKWMRAGYGKTTRNYFLENTQPLLLVDLGSGIFDEATVDSNLLLLKKTAFKHAFNAIDISKEKHVRDLDQFSERTLQITPKTDENWAIASETEQSIKTKIETKGIPLKDWDIQIYRGVLTGYNEAFIISGNKKDELIAQDPKSAEIIKPILRGRDIKRYKAEFADLWLIDSHNGIKEKGIARINIEKDYHAIYEHLRQYEAQLIKRQDKGDHWTNLRNCAYHQEFEKEKIVYSEIVREPQFLYDKSQKYPEATVFFMTGLGIKYLIAVLNSKFSFWSFRKFYAGGGLGDEGIRYKKQFLELLPIPPLSELEQAPYIAIVEQILAKKENGEDSTALEAEIDRMVYQLYGLTTEEISIVENT